MLGTLARSCWESITLACFQVTAVFGSTTVPLLCHKLTPAHVSHGACIKHVTLCGVCLRGIAKIHSINNRLLQDTSRLFLCVDYVATASRYCIPTVMPAAVAQCRRCCVSNGRPHTELRGLPSCRRQQRQRLWQQCTGIRQQCASVWQQCANLWQQWRTCWRLRGVWGWQQWVPRQQQ